MREFKVVVEKHPDTYVAYPLGLKGVVVGEGESYEAALADVKSAIQFHIETFGVDAAKIDPLFWLHILLKRVWPSNAQISSGSTEPEGYPCLGTSLIYACPRR